MKLSPAHVDHPDVTQGNFPRTWLPTNKLDPNRGRLHSALRTCMYVMLAHCPLPWNS